MTGLRRAPDRHHRLRDPSRGTAHEPPGRAPLPLLRLRPRAQARRSRRRALARVSGLPGLLGDRPVVRGRPARAGRRFERAASREGREARTARSGRDGPLAEASSARAGLPSALPFLQAARLSPTRRGRTRERLRRGAGARGDALDARRGVRLILENPTDSTLDFRGTLLIGGRGGRSLHRVAAARRAPEWAARVRRAPSPSRHSSQRQYSLQERETPQRERKAVPTEDVVVYTLLVFAEVAPSLPWPPRGAILENAYRHSTTKLPQPTTGWEASTPTAFLLSSENPLHLP